MSCLLAVGVRWHMPTLIHSDQSGLFFIWEKTNPRTSQTACAHVLIAGAERNRGHGPRLVRPEAGQEAQRAGGGRGNGGRGGGEDHCQLPQEEEKTLDQFPEQLLLGMHSDQRGVVSRERAGPSWNGRCQPVLVVRPSVCLLSFYKCC